MEIWRPLRDEDRAHALFRRSLCQGLRGYSSTMLVLSAQGFVRGGATARWAVAGAHLNHGPNQPCHAMPNKNEPERAGSRCWMWCDVVANVVNTCAFTNLGR